MKELTEHEKLIITKYDLLYEQRMTRVESAVDHLEQDMKEIKIDLRWIMGLMIAFSSIILGVMAKGFHWI
jgi:tyrosine-protein phosphatase YwqE